MWVRFYRSLCGLSLFLLFIQYIRRTRNYYFWNDTLWKLSGQTRSCIYSVINTSWVIAFILIGLFNYVSWDEISLVLHFYNILLMASFIKCIEIQQRKKIALHTSQERVIGKFFVHLHFPMLFFIGYWCLWKGKKAERNDVQRINK